MVCDNRSEGQICCMKQVRLKNDYRLLDRVVSVNLRHTIKVFNSDTH